MLRCSGSFKSVLDQMEEHHPQLKTGLERARRAEKLEDEQQYRRALVLYKEAVEFLLPLHKGTGV